VLPESDTGPGGAPVATAVAPTEAGGTLRTQLDALAGWIRDPDGAEPPPGIEPRRLALYRRLFQRNIDRLLASGFPVIRRTLDDREWQSLVDAFLRDHGSATPLFTEVSREFVAFVQALEPAPRPWLAELAHYEWVELALQLADAPAGTHATSAGDGDPDLVETAPILSPLAWPLAYRWPVHTIGPAHDPAGPPSQPTLLLLHRDTGGTLRFHLVSALAFRLLQRLDAAPADTGREHLRALAREAGTADEAFLDQGRAMLARWHRAGIVIGSREAA
jgi:uncharacterized protein